LNSAEAVERCQAGAKQGKPEIQTLLGSMYERGEGVEQNFEKAAEWYGKAAEQGYPQAQLIFGSMLFLGRGIPQNHILAHMWINLGAASSNSGDHKVATRLRDLVARNMSPRQIVQAHRAAHKWWAEFQTRGMSDRNQN